MPTDKSKLTYNLDCIQSFPIYRGDSNIPIVTLHDYEEAALTVGLLNSGVITEEDAILELDYHKEHKKIEGGISL